MKTLRIIGLLVLGAIVWEILQRLVATELFATVNNWANNIGDAVTGALIPLVGYVILLAILAGVFVAGLWAVKAVRRKRAESQRQDVPAKKSKSLRTKSDQEIVAEFEQDTTRRTA